MSADAPASGRAEDPLGAVTRVTRITLHDAVLNQIRDMIIEGTLPPGTRINEVQVGALLGVSRTPLREAIKSLASEGLIEFAPSRGAIVRRFTVEDTRDILEVLKAIEQAAGRLACERASAATIAAIEDLHARMLERYEARDRLSYFKLNQAIHTAIVAASGNATLRQVHDTMQARIKRVRFIGNERPDRWAAALAEHEEMIAALTRRDGETLAEVLGRHLDQSLDRVRDAI